MSAAKGEARALQSEIEKRMLEIQRTVQDVIGTSASGARVILSGWDEKASEVLRGDPGLPPAAEVASQFGPRADIAVITQFSQCPRDPVEGIGALLRY